MQIISDEKQRQDNLVQVPGSKTCRIGKMMNSINSGLRKRLEDVVLEESLKI